MNFKNSQNVKESSTVEKNKLILRDKKTAYKKQKRK